MKLWGGRFDGEPAALMRQLNDSFAYDRRLYAVDIRGSQAYASALRAAGLISEGEHADLVVGLERIRAEFEAGEFIPAAEDEDIHTAVERRLAELIGPAAWKLHTGRSRNDQVALDLRLWLLEAVGTIRGNLADVQSALLQLAQQFSEEIMPGYTHLQPAQPVLFAHWLMSFFWMFDRDQGRLLDCARRTAVSPLGSGALAGNPFPIDRLALARSLGMQEISQNSMDAVSDRDFAAEFLFSSAMLSLHLSRFAEDLILYASPGWHFLELPEAYTTGSSLMPQKRNPDALELVRGKSGRMVANLVGLLTVLKGLPSTYDKDLQEDKELVFSSADTLALVLPALADLVLGLRPDPEAMRAALDSSILATDLADYLVRKGLPFREAHHLAGECVKTAESLQTSLVDLPLEEYLKISDRFDRDVKTIFDFERSVSLRSTPGGTGPAAVKDQLALAVERLHSYGYQNI